MSEASKKMARAKSNLILTQTFFASIICSMKMIEEPNLPPPSTMATDGETVWYNPAFVDTLTPEEIQFVLCHEVGHCIFQHMFRRGDRHPKKWNYAGDYVINDMLAEAQIGKMPEGGLLNKQLVTAGGGTTDGVYNLLPDSPDGGGDGSGQGDGGFRDDCRDATGSEAEKAEAESAMKVKIAQAVQAAKARGEKIEGALKRLIDTSLQPKVDWRSVLRRWFDARARIDRSWARPNRKFMSQGLYLPSMGGEQMGEILVGVDVSGSIRAEELNAYFAELNGIREDVHPRGIHVEYFHHAVDHYDFFAEDEELVAATTGTGGTAFAPIFDYAEEHGIEPVCAVILTDMYGSFGEPPPYPVLWVSTGGNDAPFGEVVRMDPGL